MNLVSNHFHITTELQIQHLSENNDVMNYHLTTEQTWLQGGSLDACLQGQVTRKWGTSSFLECIQYIWASYTHISKLSFYSVLNRKP